MALVEVPVIVVVTGPPGTGKSTVATHVGRHLGAPVLGWDWVMGGIARTPGMVQVLQSLEYDSYAELGWSVMTNLTIAHLRASRSVVLDGVAREHQLETVRDLAEREAATVFTVLTSCDDVVVHEARVSRRQRRIPGWHELEWVSVEKFLAEWTAPDCDLQLDAGAPLSSNVEKLIAYL